MKRQVSNVRMRMSGMRANVIAAAFVAGLLVAVDAQQTAPPPPATPPTSAPPQQGAPAPAPPPQAVFRDAVDVIRLDVSVLDKDRHPIHGLTVDDFTVSEDGKPQRVVAVTEIQAAEQDVAPTAWMRHTPTDVASNDLVEQLGDGRVFAIVMDDWSVPFDSQELIMSAREIGRYIIDNLGPSDQAAVIFPQDVGRGQDFTSDREKLLAAIDKFEPREIDYMEPTRNGTTGMGGGDMPYRYSSALARTNCTRTQPLVPTLDTLTSRLTAIPNRRKTVVLVSEGVPLTFGEKTTCRGTLADMMKDVFRKSQRANINIYTVDPGGYRGYEDYLQNPILEARRMPSPFTGERLGSAKIRRDFLEIVADNTGARAIVNTAVWKEIDEMLAEAASYYLVGYQTSNGKPDGKLRKVDVKVKRSGTTVRTRSSFYGPVEGTLATKESKAMPSTNDLGMVGMNSDAPLPLRAVATPMGRTSAATTSEVAVVLTVRLPAPRGPLQESLTLIRNLYDSEGRTSTPVEEKRQMTLQSTTGDELRYDVYQKLTLAPGRYQLRLNATSGALAKSASVYADFEVPDFLRAPVTFSGVFLGPKLPASEPRPDPFASFVPVVPTSGRDFAASEEITAFVRVFQGGASAPVALAMKAEVYDAQENKLLDLSSSLAAAAFDATTRGAGYEVVLPLSKLSHGPHLLSLTAIPAGGTAVRKDLVFRVR